MSFRAERARAAHAEARNRNPPGSALDAAEAKSGKERKSALEALAKQVDKDVKGAKDPERVKMMSAAIKDLAKATK